jgi:hypothetical protein
MIIPSKWFPSVQPRYDFQTVVFDKAVEKVQEDYKLAIEAHKVEMKIEELEVELYNKRARVTQLEIGIFQKVDLYA